MRVVLFCHSLVSDWNHGNAHFLRGICTELLERGHQVRVYEPVAGWSASHLLESCGSGVLEEFTRAYPQLRSCPYDSRDPVAAVEDADLVLVHEWTEPHVVEALGRHRRSGGRYRLFFHDTHHRQLTAPGTIGSLDGYDGALVYGKALAGLYLLRGLVPRVWVWHEAADVRVFYPHTKSNYEGDLVWIGNWGDEERTAELEEFVIRPVETLGLKAVVHGVRYPKQALRRLERAGIEYRGWLPNFRVPEVFGRFKMTVHVPRRPYVEALPGIPTIRVFEALACGIPLVCAPWDDCERLFCEGDFLLARTGAEMCRGMERLLCGGRALAAGGLARIRERHTCAHRVNQLLSIYEEMN